MKEIRGHRNQCTCRQIVLGQKEKELKEKRRERINDTFRCQHISKCSWAADLFIIGCLYVPYEEGSHLSKRKTK